jgi:hypothetical protein
MVSDDLVFTVPALEAFLGTKDASEEAK